MTAVIGPVQLARLLRLPEPTAEQAAVISAPLGPMAVIAGAGSGKSETMAARLVWLVANGMARPDRVLGLTFTRKAAAELADRVRSRLDRLRRADLGGSDLDGDPVIGTYHAYAGRLVGDNALREGLEPSMRLITPALSWQLAAGIVAGVRRADGRDHLDPADGDRGGARAGRRSRRALARGGRRLRRGPVAHRGA